MSVRGSGRPLTVLAGALTALGIAVAGFAMPSQPSAPSAENGADGASGAQLRLAAAETDTDPLVVAVSIDGLGSNAMRRLGRSELPALFRMIDEGRGTLNARTTRERTTTLPNHTGMMTGRRVATDRGHAVRFNSDNGGTLRATAGRYVPGVFDVVHDRGGSTALYTSKDKFRFLVRSWNAEHGRQDQVGADDGRDKIDRFRLNGDADALVTALLNRLGGSSPHTLSFLHIALPDAAGHEHGWMSPRYLQAVRDSDALVGRVLDAVADDAGLASRVNVVLTADHGGVPGTTSHASAGDRRVYTIPFLVWGADVRAGGGLYRLNPERRKPGKRRTSYAGRQPIRNIDIAGSVTSLLGLPRVPGGQLRRTTPLEVS